MMQGDVNMIWSKNKNNTHSKGMVTMNFYDDLVMQTQMNYSKYYHIYASGSTPYKDDSQRVWPENDDYDDSVYELQHKTSDLWTA